MRPRHIPCSLVVLLTLGATAGCGPGERTERVHLVEHARWVLLQTGDPWADEAEGSMPCDPTGFHEEPPLFEIETGLCDYATFVQPALGSARAGDLLHVVGWHLPLLSADDGATGHLEVRIGDRVLLDYQTPIPAAETAMSEYVDVTEPVAAGTPVYLHVHNHGDNAWRLLEVSTGPEDVYGDVP